MSRNSRELDKLQRGFAKVVGPAKARALRKDLEKKIAQAAKPVQSDAQIILDLVKSKQAGWVNVHGKGISVLVAKGTGCRFVDSNTTLITAQKLALRSQGAVNLPRYEQFAKSHTAEGFVPHFYLDKTAHVTVGFGHLISNEAEARRLANNYVFTRKGTNNRSTEADLARDFNAVNLGLQNFKPRYFAPLTQHEFSAAEAERLLAPDVKIALNELDKRQTFPEFKSYPPIANLGLLDMSFNLGITRTLNVYTNFTAAVRRRDWKVAANHSNRSTASATRNAEVHRWFMEAAKLEPFFIHATCKRPLRTKKV